MKYWIIGIGAAAVWIMLIVWALGADIPTFINEQAFLIVQKQCPQCQPDDIRTTIKIYQEDRLRYRNPNSLAAKVLRDLMPKNP